MRTLLIWSFAIGCLTGCGRVITPEPEAIGMAIAATPIITVTPTLPPRPTVTPRPATPISTATPTVTPTPIIYAVQSGDTLLSIAIQFDRPAEVIQEANGIVDPRFLQIGQELIIPAVEVETEATLTPTPTPLPLVVEGINFQETNQGTLWCLGQVRNLSPDFVAQVVVEAALFDEAGALLAKEAAFTQLDVIEPGEIVPFALLFETPPDSFAQYQVVAVSGVPVSDQARYYFDLGAINLKGAPLDITTYRLTGELRNTGAADVEQVRLVAVAYDEAGQVLAQRQAELAVGLFKAGAITPFEVDLIMPHGVVDNYRVVAQALRAE